MNQDLDDPHSSATELSCAWEYCLYLMKSNTNNAGAFLIPYKKGFLERKLVEGTHPCSPQVSVKQVAILLWTTVNLGRYRSRGNDDDLDDMITLFQHADMNGATISLAGGNSSFGIFKGERRTWSFTDSNDEPDKKSKLYSYDDGEYRLISETKQFCIHDKGQLHPKFT